MNDFHINTKQLSSDICRHLQAFGFAQRLPPDVSAPRDGERKADHSPSASTNVNANTIISQFRLATVLKNDLPFVQLRSLHHFAERNSNENQRLLTIGTMCLRLPPVQDGGRPEALAPELYYASTPFSAGAATNAAIDDSMIQSRRPGFGANRRRSGDIRKLREHA
jgi:hypothetical protein